MDINNGDYFRADDKGQFFNGRSRAVQAQFFNATYYVRDDKGNVIDEKEQELIRETIAGDKSMSPVMKATDWHRQKYPAEYQAFREGKDAASLGTLLEDWPGVNPSQVKTLQYYNILTVEQLAALPDYAMQQVGMGARDLKNKAAAWLEKRRELGSVEQQAAKNKALEDQLAATNARMEAMAQQMAAFLAAGGAPASPVETRTPDVVEPLPVGTEPDTSAEDRRLAGLAKARAARWNKPQAEG